MKSSFLRRLFIIWALIFEAPSWADNRPLSSKEYLHLLENFTWIVPNQLKGQTEIIKFYPIDNTLPTLTIFPGGEFDSETEQNLFKLDILHFMEQLKCQDFRCAQLKYSTAHNFVVPRSQLDRTYPYLKSWGSLPYPPVRTLDLEINKYQESFGKLKAEKSIFDSSILQRDLDDLTSTELTASNQLTPVNNGDSKMILTRMIESSKKFFYGEVLSLSCDISTDSIYEKLQAKVAQGLDVRIITNFKYSLLNRSCLKKLEKMGINVRTGPIHSSFFVNDLGELLIGSMRISSTFFNSTGFNFLNRDSNLHIVGPASTDALQEFMWDWIKITGNVDETFDSSIDHLTRVRKNEIILAKRGEEHYSDWFTKNQQTPTRTGLCRFVAQRPNGEKRSLENLLTFLVKNTQKEIIFTSVSIEPDSTNLALDLKSRGRNGLRIDFIGNGWDGGSGELTIFLNEIVRKYRSRSQDLFADFLEYIRNWDSSRQSAKNFLNYLSFINTRDFTLWTYFNFLNYKIWMFDGYGTFFGSANLERTAFEENYEAGVFCLDRVLADKVAKVLLKDRINSVPFKARD